MGLLELYHLFIAFTNFNNFSESRPLDFIYLLKENLTCPNLAKLQYLLKLVHAINGLKIDLMVRMVHWITCIQYK